MNLDLTRRGVLRGAGVATLVATQFLATRSEATAGDESLAPRLELLGAADTDVRAQGRLVSIPQILGVRIVVGSRNIASGSRLRFSGPMDAYDVSDIAILGSVATGVVSDLSVGAVGKSGDVIVAVSEDLVAGEEYTVVVGAAVGERYPEVATERALSGSAQLEAADGGLLASTALTGETEIAPEDPWAVALAYSTGRTGEPSAPTGWVTVFSAGPGTVPKGGEVLVLLDRAQGRPGLALGRGGASRPDSSRAADAALTRRSVGDATYKVRIDDEIPPGKSIVIPLNTTADGAPVRAVEYRARTRKAAQLTTGAESIEVAM
ncbi:Ig-like domain-containing protein [Promicromonospora sukumoe]